MPQDEGAEGSRGAGVRRRRRLLVWVGVVLAAVLVLTALAAPVVLQTITRQAPARLALGDRHGCVVTASGTVKCWGANDQGQLGDATTVQRAAAVEVQGLSGVESLAAGGDHTCALAVGSVLCWGRNDRGQLGDSTTASSSVPVRIASLAGVVGIAAGRNHTCAVIGDGHVWCWGADGLGELGDGGTTDSATPVEVVGLPIAANAVSASASSTCAVTVRGRVQCWGDNSDAQLALPASDPVPTAHPALGLAPRVSRVSAGDTHSCALTLTGGVLCWGAGEAGQLGDGSGESRSDAAGVSGLGLGVADVVAGSGRSCAVRSAAAWCWGAEGVGAGSTTPIETVPSGVRAIALGGQHACALVDSGVTCWGSNDSGQLGNGTTTDSSTPVAVAGL